MRILIVSATAAEIEPLTSGLTLRQAQGERVQAGPAREQTALVPSSLPRPADRARKQDTLVPSLSKDQDSLVVSLTKDQDSLVLSLSKDEPMSSYSHQGHEVGVLVTGVGMVATASWTARVLATDRFDLALNFGLCGTFDPAIPIGSVAHVVSDCMPELGAEDGDAFLSMQELGLLGDNEPPYSEGWLRNASPPDSATLRALPRAKGITVNTVHGSARSIAGVVARFAPQIESMEGAAFMYACLVHGVQFAQVRAVSNVVEKRNRAAWKIGEAVAALCGVARQILDDL